MGWMETRAVDERVRFVMAVKQQEESFAAVCRRFGVSRKVGYKWWARYRAEGFDGLFDRSRAPLNHPHAVPPEIAEPPSPFGGGIKLDAATQSVSITVQR
jgi:putative transposase